MATAPNFYLELDRTGQSQDNLIIEEIHQVQSLLPIKLILPKYGAFYSDSLRVYSIDENTQEATLLEKEQHYIATEMLHKVTKLVGGSVCTVILLFPSVASSTLSISYQALGGHDQVNRELLGAAIAAIDDNNSNISWNEIINKPKGYPPAPHLQDALDIYGLEYVTDALRLVKVAVTTGDRAIHLSIVNEYFTEQDSFFEKYNTEPLQKVDLITALNKSAEDTLVILSEELNSIDIKFQELRNKTDLLEQKLLDYKHLNANDKLANVANLLCIREFEENGTLIDVPSIMGGLYVRLDSDNYDPNTLTWASTGSAQTTFSADQQNPPSYGPSYVFPSKNAVKFSTNQWINKQGGLFLNFSKGQTIIAVTAPRDSSNQIKLPILSSDVKKLEIDVLNGIAAQYSDINNNEISYLGKTSKFFDGGAHVTVMKVGSREKDCMCLSNTPFNFYKAPNNIDQSTLDIEGIGQEMQYLGHPSVDQNAELHLLLVYQRELSKVEIHSILTYIRLRYQVDVNYITNPSFSEGASNFATVMSPRLDFTSRDKIKVTDIPIATLDSQNTYTEPGIINPNDIKLDDGKYLFVFSESPNISFWSQEIPLDPNTRYQLKYSLVYGTVNLPDIRLMVDGVLHSKTVVLNPNKSIQRDIIYSFTTGNNPTTKLELLNHATDTTGNSFGIDNISLVRMINAVSN
jgi:hypothetical protein